MPYIVEGGTLTLTCFILHGTIPFGFRYGHIVIICFSLPINRLSNTLSDNNVGPPGKNNWIFICLITCAFTNLWFCPACSWWWNTRQYHIGVWNTPQYWHNTADGGGEKNKWKPISNDDYNWTLFHIVPQDTSSLLDVIRTYSNISKYTEMPSPHNRCKAWHCNMAFAYLFYCTTFCIRECLFSSE